MARATTREGYGTGAGRARGWTLMAPARNQSVNRYKISRGNTPVIKNDRKERMYEKNKRWTPAKMLPPP